MSRNFAALYEAARGMIQTNDNAYNESSIRYRGYEVNKTYTDEEIERILERGSITEQQSLSRYFFLKDTFYKRIILHYATLLKYCGILIPSVNNNSNISNPAVKKKYYNALDFIESFKLKVLFTRITTKVLVDGVYYGVMLKVVNPRKTVSILDLPALYCRSRFKDLDGNDIIEFNVSYFDTIVDIKARELALNTYPDVIKKAYRKYKKKPTSDNLWVFIPSGMGICFYIDNSRPFFLDTIDAILDYEKAVDNEKERELDEIRKIVVQKIPHLTDGGLLFEPEEAAVMHKGAVDMLKKSANISVLTTYADVDAIVSKTSADNVNNSLDRMLQNVYSQTGTSKEIFAATGSSSLNIALKNDLALMMLLANKYSAFLTVVINDLFKNANIGFKYEFLPISYYNEKEYIDSSKGLASLGYSWLVPAIAMDMSQRDLSNIKHLEHDIMNLEDVMIPLSSAYQGSASGGSNAPTGSDKGPGRPTLEQEEKSVKTIQNEQSIERTGQGGPV